MIISLSSSQMLQAWRKAAGLEPSIDSCSIEAFDGIDVNDRISTLMRQWYLALLDTADPALIPPPADAAGALSLHYQGGGRAIITPDQSVRRLLSVKLSEWSRPADIVDGSSIALAIAMLDNPFSAAGPASPIAWRDSSGRIFAAPATGSSSIVSSSAVIDPGPDSYILDERALETIPSPLPLF